MKRKLLATMAMVLGLTAILNLTPTVAMASNTP